MQHHLYKFLVLHRKLSIPQLGSFTIDNEPARFDVPSGLLFAPRPVIHFGETPDLVPDKVFFDFLSTEMGVEEVTAVKAFHDFAYQFRSDIQEHRLGLLPGVGRITRGGDGSLFFTPETNLLELLPPVQLDASIRLPADAGRAPAKKIAASKQKAGPAEIVVEKKITDEEIAGEIISGEEEEEEVTITERWWIPAIILLAGGLLALLFYYQ
ncbi:MAG: hypothetical protein JWQ78_103 [Sediminibacterium sp.]|nr:hypothetical protein [Sediminibacterium sp.]